MQLFHDQSLLRLCCRVQSTIDLVNSNGAGTLRSRGRFCMTTQLPSLNAFAESQLAVSINIHHFPCHPPLCSSSSFHSASIFIQQLYPFSSRVFRFSRSSLHLGFVPEQASDCCFRLVFVVTLPVLRHCLWTQIGTAQHRRTRTTSSSSLLPLINVKMFVNALAAVLAVSSIVYAAPPQVVSVFCRPTCLTSTHTPL